MHAYDIKWDIDFSEVSERLIDMKPEEAAEKLGIPLDRYQRMTADEREEYAYDAFRHSPALLDEFMGLPEKVEIPEELQNADISDITDWLSDTYGFCILGYELDPDPNYEKQIAMFEEQMTALADQYQVNFTKVAADVMSLYARKSLKPDIEMV